MKCKYSVDDIIELSEGELSPEAKEAFFKHIEECSNCHENYEALVKMEEFLRTKEECPRNISSKVMTKIDADKYSKNSNKFDLKKLYFGKYHLIKNAAIFIIIFSFSIGILYNINPIAYNLSNDIEKVKEVFVKNELEQLTIFQDSGYYFRVTYPAKWQMNTEDNLKEGGLKIYINNNEKNYIRVYGSKSLVENQIQDYDNTSIVTNAGKSIMLMKKETNGNIEFFCLIDSNHAVSGVCEKKAYFKNEEAILDIIKSVQTFDSSTQQKPTQDAVEKEKAIKIFYTSYITNPTVGRKGPGEKYEGVVSLNYGKVIYVTGKLDTENGLWYLVQGLPNFSKDNLIDQNTVEQPAFWVPKDAIDTTTQNTISFDEVFNPYNTLEYTYIVLNKGYSQIELKQLPDEKASGTCVVNADNLIAVVKKDAE